MSVQRSNIETWVPAFAVVAVWASLHTLVLVVGGAIDGDLLGTDSYMRLVRVTELVDGGGWFDSVIARSNAPFGDELHWTRPLDVLLIVLAAPLAPFVGFEGALLTAGVVVSPLLQLVTAFVAVWAATPVLGTQRARLAALVIVVQPAIFLQDLPGQADHHALQLLVLTLELGLVLRLLDPTLEPNARRRALVTGAVAGFGVWLSPEMTVVAGLGVIALGVAWLRGAIPARTLRHVATGLTAVLAVAHVVEHPPSDWLAVEYDKVSLPHLAAGLAAVLVALAFERIELRTSASRARVVWAAIVVCVVGGVLLIACRGLIEGVDAEIDPRLIPIWLDEVSEFQPLFPTDLGSFGWFLVMAGPALIALPFVVVVAWRSRRQTISSAWVTLALFFVAYFLLALRYLRFAPFAGVLIAIVSAEILGRMRDWAGPLPRPLLRRIVWPVAAPMFIVGFALVGVVLFGATSDAEGSDSAAEKCDLRAVAAAINEQPGAAGSIVFAHIDFTPELLYRTDAAFVAGPYHRNADGILDVHGLFSSADPDRSRVLAEARGTRFVLVCGTEGEETFYDTEDPGQSLYERLVSDDPPEWLSLIALGTGEQHFRLYEVQGAS